MKNKKILLVGATGLVGSITLKMLAADERVSNIILLNRREILEYSNNENVEQHIINFDHLSEYQSLINADAVICTLGTTIKKAGSNFNFYKVDHNYPVAIAEAAKKNGIENFVIVTAMGANANSKIFYNRLKGEVELALQELKFRSLTILRPGLLLGDRTEERPKEKIWQKLMLTFDFLIPAKYKAIAAEKVARAAVHYCIDDIPGENILESDLLQKY